VHEQPEATEEEHEQAPERLREEEAKSGAGFEERGEPDEEDD
jgi:hypothetical protein